MEMKLIVVSFLAVGLIPDLSFAKGNSGNSGNSINQCSDLPCGHHGTCHLKSGDDNGHCFCPGNNPACSAGDCNTDATCTFPSGMGGNQCKLTGSQTPGACVCRRDYVCTCETGWAGQHCDKPKECTGYKTLTEKDRSVQHKGHRGLNGDTYEDYPQNGTDAITSPSWAGEGWYRVDGEAGTRLAEQDQWIEYGRRYRSHTCGAYRSGYMIANHDDIGEYQTKQVDFCFSISRYCAYNHCSYCSGYDDARQGKVTNCKGYFVYYLKETDELLRYCSAP